MSLIISTTKLKIDVFTFRVEYFFPTFYGKYRIQSGLIINSKFCN